MSIGFVLLVVATMTVVEVVAVWIVNFTVGKIQLNVHLHVTDTITCKLQDTFTSKR